MKLIVNVKAIENLKSYAADGLIFSHAFLTDEDEALFTIEEIKEIVDFTKEQNKESILNLNRLFHEYELEELKEYIDLFIHMDIDAFIFSDLAVYTIFETYHMQHKLIYHARTMITSAADALFWKKKNVKSVFVSNELTLEEINEIVSVGNIAVEVYGHHQIFASKRDLLSLYFTYTKNEKRQRKFKKYTIQEELRNEKYPILENHHGTVIYSAFKYAILEELKSLEHNPEYIYINSIFIVEEELLEIVSLYKTVMESHFEAQITHDAAKRLAALDPNIYTGFLYKKTKLTKGDDLHE